jgi:hypothetical protein
VTVADADATARHRLERYGTEPNGPGTERDRAGVHGSTGSRKP